jgi:hypothetical protein
MPPPRAYVPSPLLLRSLLRPLPRQCPLFRHLPTTTIRGKKKAAKPRPTNPLEPKPDASKPTVRPGTLGNSGISEVEWWEQDEQGNETFVDAIRNQEELDRQEQLHARLEAWARGDEDANEPEFRAQIIDELKKNPSFADMRDLLDKMKTPLAERFDIADELDDDIEEDPNERNEVLLQAQEFVGELLKHPELEGHKELLLEMQNKLPEWGSVDHPEFLEAMGRVNEAVGGESLEEFQKKIQPYLQNGSSEDFPATEEEFLENEQENLQKLAKGIKEMHALLKETGADPELESEFAEMERNLSNEDDWATDVFDEDGELDTDKMEAAIARFSQLELEQDDEGNEGEDDYLTPEERADPALKAKIDKILEDPNLHQKLEIVKKYMSGALGFFHSAQSAPDPSTLSPAEMTTLQEQLKIAESDPEHLMALRRLRVNMVPPYNAHPFLGPLNEALKLAYVGANDDVRRILWRAYRKARTIPGLLKAIPDDAWDLLWYSQAVDWKSNQNRRNHLGILLGDLDSVGKQGPPNKMMGTPDQADLDAMA